MVGTGDREPDAHVMMRRIRLLLRGLLIILAVATAVALLFQPGAAYLAAIPLPILVVMYGFIQFKERESRRDVLRRSDEEKLTGREVKLDVEDAGLYTGIGLGVLLALGTFAIAAAFYELSSIGIAATALLLLALLINLPYLTLFVEEAEREELEKLRHERHQPAEK